jgi:hypothetical protein
MGDGERTIRFGRGTVATAGEPLGSGYTLLTTPRAGGSAPGVVAAAPPSTTCAPARRRDRRGAARPGRR